MVDRKVTNQSESGPLFTTWSLSVSPMRTWKSKKYVFNWSIPSRFPAHPAALFNVFLHSTSQPSRLAENLWFTWEIIHFQVTDWKQNDTVAEHREQIATLDWLCGFRSISGDTWLLFIVDAFILSEKKAIKGESNITATRILPLHHLRHAAESPTDHFHGLYTGIKCKYMKLRSRRVQRSRSSEPKCKKSKLCWSSHRGKVFICLTKVCF